jgi:hypothetical protein
MVLQGTVINGDIVLDQPTASADRGRVEVVVNTTHETTPTLSEQLRKHAGTVTGLPSDMTSVAPDRGNAASPLGEALMELAGTALGLPRDMAEQHDHYIHRSN